MAFPASKHSPEGFVTRWGISRVSGDVVPESLVLEQSFSFEKRSEIHRSGETLTASFWFLSAAEDAEHWERVAILAQACVCDAPLACVIQAPLSWVSRTGSDNRLLQLAQRWEKMSACPLYFDFGKNGPPSWIDPKYAVSDPFWNHWQIHGDYWKIHGWHSVRWVRMYSTEDLSRLVSSVGQFKPRFVILAHSQRLIQWKQIEQLMEAK